MPEQKREKATEQPRQIAWDLRELLEKLEKELEGILPDAEAQLAGVRL